MAKRQKEKVKGCKKGGRNRKWCETYRLVGQREVNKLRKIRRHIKRFPDDGVAKQALARLA